MDNTKSHLYQRVRERKPKAGCALNYCVFHVFMPKNQSLRAQLRQKRSQLTYAAQQAASQQVTLQLSQHPFFQNSDTLAVYKAVDREIDPQTLYELAWQQGKACYLPVVKTDTLDFCRYQPHTPLRPNRFAIPEPYYSTESRISPQALDLVLIPLLAFDSYGHRLGTGGGYYDRSFGFLLQRSSLFSKPYLVGLAYEWQQISLDPACWDVPLMAIVTEKTIYVP